MKRIITAYLALSRTERMGFAAIIILLLLLILVWQTMPYWVAGPSLTSAESRQRMVAFARYKAAHQVATSSNSDASFTEGTGTLFPFDPNTLDSSGFIRLGLSPKVVKGLMNWRRHGKKFYRKEDLKPLYNLTPEAYARLEPYIAIAATERPGFSYSRRQLPPLPATIDLNMTDSATLVRLNGIGPTLAHKIITRRNALGGFLKLEQLLEVYRFSDSTYSMLREKLVIRPEMVKRIALNTATQEQLQAHPYIGEKLAKNLLLFRNGLRRFDNIQQLRQVPLMNEEIYRKIAPYFYID